MNYDYVIVGAGFAGTVMAERLASVGERVLVIDKRPHVGGNAYDYHDVHGILVHKYGPHIFHTNSDAVYQYLSQFTEWRPYEHRVLARYRDKLYPIPINRTTLELYYGGSSGLHLSSDEETREFLDRIRVHIDKPKNSEEVVLSAVGPELYSAFFKEYTEKQWGVSARELSPSVISRIPTRTNRDDRYFTDKYQVMPRDGYTKMFVKMLDRERIDVRLNTSWQSLTDEDRPTKRLIFTGPIDEFFGHAHGQLQYRSLKFVHKTYNVGEFQPVGTVNYPSKDMSFTRVTEFKHLTGQVVPNMTSIVHEYPSDIGEPYYPVPAEHNHELLKKYESLARERDDVIFLGRLGTYRYLNMDATVAQALATFRRLQEGEDRPGPV